MSEHGGAVLAACREFNLDPKQVIDLSTGINPNAYPVPPVESAMWHMLPQDEDGLIEAAIAYYGSQHLLPTAGSQAAIQILPYLRKPGSVAVLFPSYADYAHTWAEYGHSVKRIGSKDLLNAAYENDVVVVCNPNNPTGEYFSVDLLHECKDILAKKNGWLIVDEAFADVDSGDADKDWSLSKYTGTEGLIVLRSLGKFFGLAGARVGFVLAWPQLLSRLQLLLGPWTISGPSRYAAKAALADLSWQSKTRSYLRDASARLKSILCEFELEPQGSTPFFHWVVNSRSRELYQLMGQSGILVRYFSEPASLRFGLPGSEEHWQRLQELLQEYLGKNFLLNTRKTSFK